MIERISPPCVNKAPPRTRRAGHYPDLAVDELRDELADVFVLVSALASSFDVDLTDAVQAKFFESDATRHWETAHEASRDEPGA